MNDHDPTGRRLALLVGLPAGLIAGVAFLLWGFNSTGLLVEMIAAYCL